MKKQKCCICDCNYKGYGNNAEPLNNGRCCDDCNKIVILERLKEALRK